MLRRTENLNNFLDITTLELGEEYVKIAYLQHVTEGRTEGTNSGFFRLYIKDMNGNVIIGRLFNIASYEESGLTILALKGKPVKIHFRVDAFNGSLNLLLNSVQYYDGLFEYASFIGEYAGASKSYDFANNAFKKLVGQSLNGAPVELPITYKTVSLRTVYEGRVGAYTFILEKVLLNIIALKDLPNVNIKQMAKIFYLVQNSYFQYLKRIEDLDFIPLGEKLSFINRLNDKSEDSLIAVEILSALLNFSKPETLIGITLYDYMETSLRHLNLLCVNQILVEGMSREVGGQRLVKY